jgi:hypothetical protein
MKDDPTFEKISTSTTKKERISLPQPRLKKSIYNCQEGVAADSKISALKDFLFHISKNHGDRLWW